MTVKFPAILSTHISKQSLLLKSMLLCQPSCQYSPKKKQGRPISESALFQFVLYFIPFPDQGTAGF